MSVRPKLRRNLPLLTACLILAGGGIASTMWQLSRPFPIHRWESAFVAECFRMSAGFPVYESAEQGHATHMYGPATNMVVGGLFRLTGPGLMAGRLVSLSCLVLAAWLLLAVARPRGSVLTTGVAIALIAAFGRTACDYIDPRPDCASLLFGLVTTTLLFRAHQRQSWRWTAAATAVLVAGFLFKQPTAMVAAIPVVASLVSPLTCWNRATLLRLATPFAAIFTCLGVLRFGFPTAYHYMITVPSGYGILSTDAVGWATWFAGLTAFVWLGLSAARPLRAGWRTDDPKLAWFIAAACVTVPCGIIMAAKTGGMANCLLPAWFSVVGLFLYTSTPLERWLSETGDTGNRLRRHAGTALTACLVLTLLLSRQHGNSLTNAYGDHGFSDVVRAARQAGGQVVCPQDPAAALMATGRPGRSLILEYDAAGWPRDIPDWFFDELAHADYVISLDEDWRAWPLSAASLGDLFRSHGFEPVDVPALRHSAYGLWQRTPLSTVRYNPPHTALGAVADSGAQRGRTTRFLSSRGRRATREKVARERR